MAETIDIYTGAQAPIEDKSTQAATGLLTGLGTLFGGPLGGLAGSVLSGIFSAKSAKSQQKFQEYMSSTAHQREVADLRAAGLNPILSAGGKGASTPSGQSVTFENPVAAANSARVVGAQLDNIKADTLLKTTQSAQANESAKLTEIQASNAKQLSNAVVEKGQSDAAIAAEQVLQQKDISQQLKWVAIKAKTDAQLSSFQSQIAEQTLISALKEGQVSATEFGQLMAYVKRAAEAVLPFVNSAKSIMGR